MVLSVIARVTIATIFTGVSIGAAKANEPCGFSKSIAGEWRFTTLVTEAKKRSGVGVNGRYLLSVATDGCKAKVRLTKTGYGSVHFSWEAQETATVEAEVDTIPPRSEGADPEFIRRESQLNFRALLRSRGGGVGAEMAFHIIVHGERMYGRWEYLGQSWRTAGMAGSLLGSRGDGEAVRFSHHRQIPCDMACVLDGFYFESNSSYLCIEGCEAGELTGVGRKLGAEEEPSSGGIGPKVGRGETSVAESERKSYSSDEKQRDADERRVLASVSSSASRCRAGIKKWQEANLQITKAAVAGNPGLVEQAERARGKAERQICESVMSLRSAIAIYNQRGVSEAANAIALEYADCLRECN